jgi:hypothetical protein
MIPFFKANLMRFSDRPMRATIGLVAWITPWLLIAAQSPGNEPLRLVIEGEEYQNCIVSVRYIRTRQVAKSLVTRVPLMTGVADEPIESQHDGVEIWVQSASAPLVARLMKDQQPIQEETLDEPGVLRLSVGRSGPPGYSPPPIELTDSEIKLVRAIDEAFISQGSTQNLVSRSANSKIDWPSLDLVLRELQRLIGTPDPEPDRDASSGWIAWNDSQGTRMLAGVLYGQDAACGLKLAIEGELLMDVVIQCEPLADDYYREPLDYSEYAQQAEQLTRNLFAGQAAEAHQLYAPQFQKEVSVQQLKELSDLIRERYGKAISNIEFKRIDLLPYDYVQQNRLLHLDHIVELDGGSRCISRVVFNIPSSRSQVGKANLGAVNIYEVFSSSHPELAQATQDLIDQLSKGMTADQLVNRFPPLLQSVARAAEIEASLTRIGQYFSHSPPQNDFDLWSVWSVDDWLQASGPIQLGSEKGFLEFHFLKDGPLLGFSAFGPAMAESTLGSFDFEPVIPKTAQRFWGYLMREDARSAHGMLAPEFQQQFPLNELKAQLEAVQEETAPVTRIDVDAIRLTGHVDRARAVMATVFLTATFEDDSTQSLACELAWPLPSDPPGSRLVYDFSNDFDFDFPVASIPLASGDGDGAVVSIDALRKLDAQAILELIDPSKRSGVDLAALTAYLQQFRQIAGELGEPRSISRVAEFISGAKQTRCNALLNNQAGDSFPVEIWFRSGYLERFSVSHASMLQFVDLIEDTRESERRIRAFIKNWFTDLPRTQIYLASTLKSESMLKTLEQVRGEFVAEHGRLAGLSVSKKGSSGGGGTQEFEVTLQGGRSQKNIKFNMEFGAFGGLISGIEF